MMYDSFYNEHKYDIRTILGQDTLDSPITDIVEPNTMSVKQEINI